MKHFALLFTILFFVQNTALTQAQTSVIISEPLLSISNGDLTYYTDAVFSPDGLKIFAAASDNNICVYNNNGQLLTVFAAHNKAIRNIAFTPDGNLLSVSEDKSIKLWTPDGNLLNTIDAHSKSVTSVAVSHNGKYWVSTSEDKTAKIWSNKGKLLQTLKGHSDAVNLASFSPDDNFILTASKDNTIKVWTINGEMLRTFNKFAGNVRSVAYSGDGRQILVSVDNDAYLLSQSGKQLATFTGHSAIVNTAVFSPNGKYVITASNDKLVKLWTIEGTLVCTYAGYNRQVNSARFSDDGRFIISSSLDNSAKLWATVSASEVASVTNTLQPPPVIYAVPVNNSGAIDRTGTNKGNSTSRYVETVEEDSNYESPIFSSFDMSPLDNLVQKPKVWAVVVGIANYNHVQSLKFTKDDAYLMYAFLKSPEGGALPDEQITLLIDANATKNQIMSALQKTFSDAGPNDAILFYYAGHGITTGLLPIDYDGFNNVMPYGDIYSIFQASRAKYKLCITDACYAGSFSEYASRGADEVKDVLEKYYSAIKNANGGTAILMSSKAQEKSVEYLGLRQGVFSHFLIRGLKGEADENHDKLITIIELFNFVQTNVRSYTGNAQSPSLFGNFDISMPVGGVR